MKQCQKCYTQNNEESQYCESCGAPLGQGETSRPTAMFYQQAAPSQHPTPPIQYPIPERIYTPPPPSPGYTQNYAPTQLATGHNATSPARKERKRSGVSLFFGILLYLLGGFAFAFGLAAIFMVTGNNTIVGFAFIAGFLASLLILIFILILHRHPRLRGWVRVAMFAGATVVALIALLAIFATHPTNQPITGGQYIVMGIICLIYGIATEVIALL